MLANLRPMIRTKRADHFMNLFCDLCAERRCWPKNSKKRRSRDIDFIETISIRNFENRCSAGIRLMWKVKQTSKRWRRKNWAQMHEQRKSRSDPNVVQVAVRSHRSNRTMQRNMNVRQLLADFFSLLFFARHVLYICLIDCTRSVHGASAVWRVFGIWRVLLRNTVKYVQLDKWSSNRGNFHIHTRTMPKRPSVRCPCVWCYWRGCSSDECVFWPERDRYTQSAGSHNSSLLCRAVPFIRFVQSTKRTLWECVCQWVVAAIANRGNHTHHGAYSTVKNPLASGIFIRFNYGTAAYCSPVHRVCTMGTATDTMKRGDSYFGHIFLSQLPFQGNGCLASSSSAAALELLWPIEANAKLNRHQFEWNESANTQCLPVCVRSPLWLRNRTSNCHLNRISIRALPTFASVRGATKVTMIILRNEANAKRYNTAINASIKRFSSLIRMPRPIQVNQLALFPHSLVSFFMPFHKYSEKHSFVPKRKPISGSERVSEWDNGMCGTVHQWGMRFHSVIVAAVVVVAVAHRRTIWLSVRQAGIGVLSSVTVLPPPHFVWLMRANKLVFFHSRLKLHCSGHVHLNTLWNRIPSARTPRKKKKHWDKLTKIIIGNNNNNSISNFLPHTQIWVCVCARSKYFFFFFIFGKSRDNCGSGSRDQMHAEIVISVNQCRKSKWRERKKSSSNCNLTWKTVDTIKLWVCVRVK